MSEDPNLIRRRCARMISVVPAHDMWLWPPDRNERSDCSGFIEDRALREMEGNKPQEYAETSRGTERRTFSRWRGERGPAVLDSGLTLEATDGVMGSRIGSLWASSWPMLPRWGRSHQEGHRHWIGWSGAPHRHAAARVRPTPQPSPAERAGGVHASRHHATRPDSCGMVHICHGH